MRTLLVLVYLLQLPPAPASLPAPVNLQVRSLNLRHVLHWEPGPGSPPGTRFTVYQGVGGRKLKPLHRNTTSTSFTLKLNIVKTYELAVQASYNHTFSPLSDRITFDPFASKNVVIGPPLLSLVGCGTYIQVNVSLPDGIQKIYDASFIVLWREGEDGKVQELEKRETSFNLTSLKKDTEYCVKVDTKTRAGVQTRPSEWRCAITGISEPANGMSVLVAVTALLIFLLVVLSVALVGLHYTGFLCKLKGMPAALMFAQWPDHVFIPNTTLVDQVAIFSPTEKQRSGPAAAASPYAGRLSSEDEDCDEEEEEDDAGQLYVNRSAELSSDRGSGSLGEDATRQSGGLVEKPPAEEEEEEEEEERQAASDRYEAKAESVPLSFVRDLDLSGLRVGAAAPEEEAGPQTPDVSGDVNLFSVTLASMAARDHGDTDEEPDEEPDSAAAFLLICSLKPGRDDGMSAPLLHPSEESLAESGYGSRRADSWMSEAEAAGGSSGYLTNR